MATETTAKHHGRKLEGAELSEWEKAFTLELVSEELDKKRKKGYNKETKRKRRL